MPLNLRDPYSQFIYDENNTLVGVAGQRFVPKNYSNFNAVSVVAPTSTFTAPGVNWDSNSGNVRLTGGGAHGLTGAVATTAGVYVTWTGPGAGVSGIYSVTAIDTDTTGTKITINLPYVSGTATFSTSSSTVATVTFSSYNLVSGQTTVTPTYNAPVLVNWTAHGRVPGDTLQFATTGSLPTGLATSTTYYVSRVIDANSFTVMNGATNGIEILCSTDGSGTQTAIVTPTVVTWSSHGRSVGDPVRLTTSGSLPTGFSTGTTYYVSNVLSANTFTLSASVGGAPILATAVGSGTHTCILWYGSAAVTLATNSITLASFSIEGNALTPSGNLEANALFSMTSSSNAKRLTMTYGGSALFDSGAGSYTTGSITGVNVNKIAWARGGNTVVTSAAASTGHGTTTATGGIQTFTLAYTGALTFAITATPASANEVITLQGYQVSVE